MHISQKQAISKLVDFITNTADLDDLASLTSKYIADGKVTVEGSDPHENGERVKD